VWFRLYTMYPLGHFALAYFFVQVLGLFVKEDYNILLIWFVSIIPDLDFFLAPYIVHRGPSHSLITMILSFIPVFWYYKRGSKYFAALVSHLLGDYITYAGIKLLWPFSNKKFMAPRPFLIRTNILWKVEVILFSLTLLHIGYIRYRSRN